MAEIANVLTRTFNPGQQRCGVGVVFVVVENNLAATIDVVLQPASQNIECRFGG
ncbi:hypothetical protein KWI10_24085 [Enterobacter asburiae]|nr:hypothetical protein [Enterobacter asburiae]